MAVESIRRTKLADEPTPLHPRMARSLLRETEDFIATVAAAMQHARSIGAETDHLARALEQGQSLRRHYAALANERITPRRRPGKEKTWRPDEFRRRFTLYLDECGSAHVGHLDPHFPVFCLCGVIIDELDQSEVDRRWRAWKDRWLGDARAIVHEPDLRRWSGPFHAIAQEDRDELLRDLDELLQSLDLTVIAAVVHTEDFHRDYCDGVVDRFLPTSPYLMCVDFIAERFAHFLYHSGDAWGRIIAEARGKLEDSRVQLEYVRLHVEGTQFMAERTFQYHMRDTIQFSTKTDDVTGLQIADLLARCCAERVHRPERLPARRKVVEACLHGGALDEPWKYGLKVFPSSARDRIFPV